MLKSNRTIRILQDMAAVKLKNIESKPFEITKELFRIVDYYLFFPNYLFYLLEEMGKKGSS